MIVVSLFFVRQLNFMLDKDLGFRTQNIIRVPFMKPHWGNSFMSQEEYRTIMKEKREIISVVKQKLEESPFTEQCYFGDFPVSGDASYEYKFTLAGKETECLMFHSDASWFKLFDVRLLEGRLWNNEIDNRFGYNFIVTESTLKQFGITDYREALMQPYQRIWWASGGTKR